MIFDLIFGSLLLLAGRKLFWLAIGVIGFMAGVRFGYHWAAQADSFTLITVAILVGILGAMLAVAFEWFSVIFVFGFLGGGYFLTNMLSSVPIAHLPLGQEPYSSWMLFIIGGITGMIVVIMAFDWALIIISSLLGAMLIVQHLHLEQSVRAMVFIGSVLVGILLQYLTADEEELKEEE